LPQPFHACAIFQLRWPTSVATCSILTLSSQVRSRRLDALLTVFVGHFSHFQAVRPQPPRVTSTYRLHHHQPSSHRLATPHDDGRTAMEHQISHSVSDRGSPRELARSGSVHNKQSGGHQLGPNQSKTVGSAAIPAAAFSSAASCLVFACLRSSCSCFSRSYANLAVVLCCSVDPVDNHTRVG